MKPAKRSLRILFLTPYYPPEMGAPQARIADLAARLAKNGHIVTVLTGFPNYPAGKIYPGYRYKIFQKEIVEGVKVLRTWIFPASNKRLYWRLVNYFSFIVSSIISSFRCGRTDVIYVESPPLFDGIPGYIISKLKRAPFLFNVADLWPDFAVELGLVKPGILLSVVYRMESFFYKKAKRISTVTEGLINRLNKEKNVPEEKLVLLSNGVDTGKFHPEISGEHIRKKYDLADKFITAYIGNFGHWQGLETIIDTAELLKDEEKFHFMLIGDGAKKDEILEYADSKNLKNMTILPAQNRDLIPEFWAAVDCAVVPLRKVSCAAQALPVKMFEALAMGKPVIAGIKGEAERLINKAQAGITVEPEHPVSYVNAIKELNSDRKNCEDMGLNGRRFVEENFNRDNLAGIVEDIFLEMTK
ncbi:glycosyltransferase family 4 protein [candidate division KSB1 bacterium]